MPGARNQRGGKGFKKGKKRPSHDKNELDFPVGKFDRADGEWQDYGRVLRLLGDRRVLCFCNDGNERVAKIRGALCKGPKKKIIERGDIVLLSFRDFMGRIHVSGTSMEAHGISAAPDAPATAMALTTSTGRKEIADLLEKYDRHHWDEIRHLPDIHPRLFVATSDDAADQNQHDDDIFRRETDNAASSDSDEEEESSDSEVDVDAI